MLTALLLGCSSKPSSMGTEGSILIVADQLDVPIIRPEIERLFGKTIYTPQPESSYRISWTDAAALADYSASPLILLAATIDGEGSTADLLKKMLSPSINEGVLSGEYFVFRRINPWARPQLLLIIVGRDQRDLGANILEWSDSLYAWAEDFEHNRIKDQIFRKGEQRDIEKIIAEKYDFRLRVQHDYLIAQENDSLNFIRIIRHYPERWIMVAYGELKPDQLFDGQFIYNRRKLIGSAFLDPVMTYDDNWTTEEVNFAGMDAVLVRGIWATIGPEGGGPFFCYGIRVPGTDRYFMVDGAAFAPGEEKMPLLWQLEIIARTFEVDIL